MPEENIEIKKDMTIAEIIKIKPQSASILMSRGMHCLGCVIAQGETLEQAAEVHGIPVQELIDAINKG
jgi:hybrid cluster-associated redox disulfide protein